MSKRALRIVKHLGGVPWVAACTSCGKEFKASLSALPRVKDAQSNLQAHVERHKCPRRTSARPDRKQRVSRRHHKLRGSGI
jgi:hypothetical protein